MANGAGRRQTSAAQGPHERALILLYRRTLAKNETFVVALTRDEGKPILRINQQAVIAFGARQIEAANDSLRRRVDFDELTARLDGSDDVSGHRIVLCVASLAVEWDRRDAPVALDIDDRFRLPVFIRTTDRAAFRARPMLAAHLR